MKLSVIIPQALSDPRGRLEFLESWCRQTGVDADEYEIVVAVNDRDESGVRRCRELVRPQDQVVAFHGENDMHYYQAGVDVARGRLLLLTENHVVADKECVANVLAFFERTAARSAFVKAGHINHSRFARHEGELFDRQVKALWLQPHCWDRVHLRGFVIERDLLHEVGGLPWQYELFCGRLLSLRMLQNSIPIDYCPDAAVYHVNLSNLDFLQHEIRSYVENEFRYRDESCTVDEEFELGTSPTLERRRLWDDNLIGSGAAAVSSALRSRLARWRLRTALPLRTLLSTMLCWRIAAALGPQFLKWQAECRLLWKRLRYSVLQFSPTKGNYAFEDVWNAVADVERARYCTAHPQLPASRNSINWEAVQGYQGFYGLESWQGHQFRWSEPVAVLTLDLPPGESSICIDTGGIRGASCDFRFELYFNGKPIEQSTIEIENGCIRFGVDADRIIEDSTQTLLILTKPMRVSKRHSTDARKLGMPVCGVTVQSMSAASSPALKKAA